MENKCNFCKCPIKESDNFCPTCGEPLNERAKEVLVKKEKSAQAKLILALLDVVEDKKTISMLSVFMEDLKK